MIGKVIGTKNDRELKSECVSCRQNQRLGTQNPAPLNEALKQKTAEFKTQFEQGTSLDTHLPEALQSAIEASKPVSLAYVTGCTTLSGILHEGKIAEMRG